MCLLHENDLYHLDLKPANVLVFETSKDIENQSKLTLLIKFIS